MPVLSLAKIIHFRFKYFQHSDLIYYEIFPKYLRVINKIFKKEIIEKIISYLTQINIKKIPHGDIVKEYGNVRLKSYYEIARICNELENNLRQDLFFDVFSKLIGQEAAEAASKSFCPTFSCIYIFFQCPCYTIF